MTYSVAVARGADARRRRRIRLGEDDARACDDAAAFERRRHPLSRSGHSGSQDQGNAAVAPPHADRLPGPLRVAQPSHVESDRSSRKGSSMPARPPAEERQRVECAGGGSGSIRHAGPLSARVLRRAAPAAYRDRARHGAEAAPRDAGRTDQRTRDISVQTQIVELLREIARRRPALSLYQDDLKVVALAGAHASACGAVVAGSGGASTRCSTRRRPIATRR